MVLVPTEISKNPFCWQYMAPRGAARPFARARPRILTEPLSFAREVTRVFVVPTAQSSRYRATRFHLQIEEYFDCRQRSGRRITTVLNSFRERGARIRTHCQRSYPAENRQICLIARDSKIQRIQGRHDDNSRKKVAHLQFDMNQSGDRSARAPTPNAINRVRTGRHSCQNQRGGYSRSHWECTVHRQIRKVQDGIGDVDAQSHQCAD